MSNGSTPGGADKAWVDADRTAPQNAFDKEDGYSGQQYHKDAEAAQGRADAEGGTPHERSTAEEGAPEDPNDFAVPGSSGPRQLP